jgi:spectinomycin phosphotransferase
VGEGRERELIGENCWRSNGAENRSTAACTRETVTGAMETPPPEGLVDDDIAGGLADSWGLDIERLRYLPKGFGSYHWLGETPGGQAYFISVDDLDVKPWLGSDRESTFEGLQAAYDTAVVLHDQARLHFVVSPVPGQGGLLARRVTPRYSLAVFPFLDGDAGVWGHPASQEDRDELLRRLAELHRSTPIVAARAPRRGLELPGRASLETALEEVFRPWTGGPFSELARSTLSARTEAVCDWLTAFDDLAARVSTATVDPVITHGEPHPGNLMRLDTELLIVDWDTVALAPPERDLWMLDDGSAESLASYSNATGRPVNGAAIDLYRLAWTLADIAAFIVLFRSEHEKNHGTQKAWGTLTDLLEGTPPQPYGSVPTAEQ